jgi:hypothetical protein
LQNYLDDGPEAIDVDADGIVVDVVELIVEHCVEPHHQDVVAGRLGAIGDWINTVVERLRVRETKMASSWLLRWKDCPTMVNKNDMEKDHTVLLDTNSQNGSGIRCSAWSVMATVTLVSTRRPLGATRAALSNHVEATGMGRASSRWRWQLQEGEGVGASEYRGHLDDKGRNRPVPTPPPSSDAEAVRPSAPVGPTTPSLSCSSISLPMPDLALGCVVSWFVEAARGRKRWHGSPKVGRIEDAARGERDCSRASGEDGSGQR